MSLHNKSTPAQVVGTSNPARNLLELCEQGKCIGDFSETQQDEIFDPRSRRRFADLLNIMARLKLLRFQIVEEVPGSSSAVIVPSVEGVNCL